MPKKNRETLKNYFKKGGFATEKEFSDLIDSSMNIIDDGISINAKNGLKLNPLGIFTKLVSFFKKKSQINPEFSIDINHDNSDGLSINNSENVSLLKIKQDGKIGVKTNDPSYDFEINGTVGINTRLGVFKKGYVPANNRWYRIIENLDGINGFEIVSVIKGRPLSGEHCASHTTAISTFGGKKSKSFIKTKNANWGSFLQRYLNKIELRWTGDLHSYNLEIRSKKNFGLFENGDQIKIKYNIIRIIE